MSCTDTDKTNSFRAYMEIKQFGSNFSLVFHLKLVCIWIFDLKIDKEPKKTLVFRRILLRPE